jgi:hypothetical protein
VLGLDGTGPGPLDFPEPDQMISVDLPVIAGRHAPLQPVPELQGKPVEPAAGAAAATGIPAAAPDDQEPASPPEPRQQLPAWIARLLQPSSSEP